MYVVRIWLFVFFNVYAIVSPIIITKENIYIYLCMKFCLFLILLFSVPVFSQANITVDKNSLVWENVYISEDSNVADYLSRHPRLKIESNTGGLLKGKGSMLKSSCTDTGADSGYISFDFEMQPNGNKYRITVSNICFGSKKTVKAETIFLNNGVLRTDARTVKSTECLESFFNRLFARAQVFKNKS